MIQIGEQITMSSIELVQFINNQRDVGAAELAHSDFLKKVLHVLGPDAGKFSAVYKGGNGQDRPCYKFPKREACLMAMSYSYDLQAKVYDRMTALEHHHAPALPRTFAQALRQLADSEEAKEKLAMQLQAQAPAVAFVERYVEARSSKAISDVAKLLGAKPHQFFAWLDESSIIFKRAGNWLPHSAHAKMFDVKTGEKNGHAYMQSRFTPEGIEWIAGRWARRNA